MSNDTALLRCFHTLLQQERTAALGTLTPQNEPSISMVPYAVDTQTACLIVHISELAAHTRYLLARQQSSIMICQSPQTHQPVHNLPRVTLQTCATLLNRDTQAWQHAHDAYIKRFPDVAFMTEFKDFHFFALEPLRVRQIAGFGAARTLTLEQAKDILRQL